MLASVASAMGVLACVLVLVAVGCAVFAFAYLLQGTWLVAALLFGGCGVAATSVTALAGLARRRTARRRACAAAALASRWRRMSATARSRCSAVPPKPQPHGSSARR
jgi:uncharacterized membrane protein YjjP (DUF1212 family)